MKRTLSVRDVATDDDISKEFTDVINNKRKRRQIGSLEAPLLVLGMLISVANPCSNSAQIYLLTTFLGLPIQSSILPTVDEVTNTDPAQSGTMTSGDSTTT